MADNGRIFIFSNVHKYSDNRRYCEALRRLGFTESDTLVFLNTCVPLSHIYDSSVISKPMLVTIHREQCAAWGGGIYYFGEAEVYAIIPQNHTFDTTIYRLKNDGTISNPYTKTNRCTIQIDEDYPKKKMPTTGYFAIKFAEQYLKGAVVPVNFYGSDDNSTFKYCKHAWDYEDKFVKSIPTRIFLEE